MKSLFLSLLLTLALASSVFAQEVPKVELFAGYSTLNSDPGGSFTGNGRPQGWEASVNFNVNRWFAIEADASGYYRSERFYNFSTNTFSVSRSKTNAHSFLIGPRFNYRTTKNITPYVHALAGVSTTSVNVTTDVFTSDGVTGASFFGTAPSQRLEASYRFKEFASAFGGGFDLKISDKLHWRAFQADYLRTRGDGFSRNNIRFSLGLVFRIGKK
ncbi:MAG: outer membrane beta-barrel protein [Blastocatellia bacterium]